MAVKGIRHGTFYKDFARSSGILPCIERKA
jgi:hypothetical protein